MYFVLHIVLQEDLFRSFSIHYSELKYTMLNLCISVKPHDKKALDKNKHGTQAAGLMYRIWRRGRDSNPCGPQSPNGFQDRPVMTASVPLRI